MSHHKHLKSTNLLERLNEELKRRTLVVRIFPNAASCLRLSRALAVEIHARCQQQKQTALSCHSLLKGNSFRIAAESRQGARKRAEGEP